MACGGRGFEITGFAKGELHASSEVGDQAVRPRRKRAGDSGIRGHRGPNVRFSDSGNDIAGYDGGGKVQLDGDCAAIELRIVDCPDLASGRIERQRVTHARLFAVCSFAFVLQGEVANHVLKRQGLSSALPLVVNPQSAIPNGSSDVAGLIDAAVDNVGKILQPGIAIVQAAIEAEGIGIFEQVQHAHGDVVGHAERGATGADVEGGTAHAGGGHLETVGDGHGPGKLAAGSVDRERDRQDLCAEFLAGDLEDGLIICGNLGIGHAPERTVQVGAGRREPVAQLRGGGTAVELVNQGLTVTVVPEADGGSLPVGDGAGGGRSLAEIVVDAVNAGEEVDGAEEIIADRSSGGAQGVLAIEIARWLDLVNLVGSRAETCELVKAVGVGHIGLADGSA